MNNHVDGQQNPSIIAELRPQFYCQHPGPITKAPGVAVSGVQVAIQVHLLMYLTSAKHKAGLPFAS